MNFSTFIFGTIAICVVGYNLWELSKIFGKPKEKRMKAMELSGEILTALAIEKERKAEKQSVTL